MGNNVRKMQKPLNRAEKLNKEKQEYKAMYPQRLAFLHGRFTVRGNSDQSEWANSLVGQKAAQRLDMIRKKNYGLSPIESGTQVVPAESSDLYPETSDIL